MSRGLRVAIDARLYGGTSGGVEQVIIGLAWALSQLDHGEDRYDFLAYRDSTSWIQPYLSGPSGLVAAGWLHPPVAIRMASRVPILGKVAERAAAGAALGDVTGADPLPRSSGFVERLGAQVIHFTKQSGAFTTDIPSIYQPHDLQHLHLPKFFSPAEIDERERIYRAGCEQASMVAVMSHWGRNDLLERYGLPEDRVRVVPWAPVLESYPAMSAAAVKRMQERNALPDAFLLYPAQTWPHKNHATLLRALAHLTNTRRVKVPLVCTGHLTAHHDELREMVRALRLEDQVTFTGFISPTEMKAMYGLARALVFPSMFEGWGMPVLEAFSEGLPVVCSRATMLPAMCRGAARLVDPLDESSLSDAIIEVWEDDAVREALTAAGRIRAADFSWSRTARLFRSHYRRLGGHGLSAEDDHLLSAPSLV